MENEWKAEASFVYPTAPTDSQFNALTGVIPGLVLRYEENFRELYMNWRLQSCCEHSANAIATEDFYAAIRVALGISALPMVDGPYMERVE